VAGVPIEAPTAPVARLWTALLADLVTRLKAAPSAALQVVGDLTALGAAVVTGNLSVGGTSTLAGAVTTTTTLTAGGKITGSAGADINAPVNLIGSLGTVSVDATGILLDFSRAGNNFVRATNAAGTLNLGVVAQNPALTVTATGAVQVAKTFYPPTPAGAVQAGVALYAIVTGAPSNALGANGDFCLRGDGGAGTCLYHREAGVWVGRA
jgi:hypothetical protein